MASLARKRVRSGREHNTRSGEAPIRVFDYCNANSENTMPICSACSAGP